MRNNLRKGNVEMQRKKVRSAGRLGRQAFVPGGLFLRFCGCAVVWLCGCCDSRTLDDRESFKDGSF